MNFAIIKLIILWKCLILFYKSRFYKSSDKFNTSISRYVWLPIRFVENPSNTGEDMAYIDWKDEWRIEDYN